MNKKIVCNEQMSRKVLMVSLFASSLILAGSPELASAGSTYRWNQTVIGANKTLHSNTKKRGSGVRVGVLDGLARCTHTELAGRCRYWTHSAGTYRYWNNHGTHVATTIGASNTGRGGMVGIAPKAYIESFGVFDDDGWVSDHAETDAVNKARGAGARVINMSYGPKTRGQVMAASTYRNIIKTVNQKVVFVLASGNSGVRLNSAIVGVNAYQRMKNTILVGAVGSTKKLAPYSNRPGEGCFYLNGTCNQKNKYKYFTVVAPGTKIYAGLGNGSYGTLSGTSMAAPHVTGVVALLHGYWPILKSRAGATANIIFKTAQDLGARGVDGLYGWGLVRADRALSPQGKTYLSKNAKLYGLAATSLRATPAAAALTNHSVTLFDEYDRDFQIPLASIAPTYRDVIGTWMRDGYVRQEFTLDAGGGLSYAVSANGYNPMDPELSDIQWRMSYQDPDGAAWHLGQGVASDRLDSIDALAFGLMADRDHQSGAYPILSLADGGLYTFTEQPLGGGFTVTGGLMTNNSFDTDAADRDYAPRSEALVVSVGHGGQDERLSVALSATYLTEEDGLLGSRGVGGLGFTEGAQSEGLTFNTSYQLTSFTRLSASYTESLSRADTSTDNLLTLKTGRLSSNAFAVGLRQQRLFTESDELMFSVAQPLRIRGGNMTLEHDDYYDEDGKLHARSVDIDLASSGRQIDYQLQYRFTPKKDLDISAFAFYANDYLHQENQTDHGLGFRLKGQFR